eukprot:gnl/MRDRNA2_/MRDRNA2_92467_c0_seq1.p1 gnl/MRDRNA2_/MRDRNA2_92467_c0~~gnl/MRDRNA2_/MRDRNA2_92467_c0_seq1.p1  ORF type:complete len:344 (-),score=104.20 gnl/MRDRNA2_/MRDRNA2_92467_c0_seq1:59-1090(-)
MGNFCANSTPGPQPELKVNESGNGERDKEEEEEDEDDDDDYVDEIPENTSYKSKGQRCSVSAEAYGAWNKKTSFQAPVIPKTPEQEQRIRQAISGGFMFQALDEKDLQVVISAFKEEKLAAGKEVITQYDEDADRLYLIEKGDLKVYKKESKTASHPGKHVFTYKGSGVFGELAMLYNCPRAATIIAEGEVVVWTIDRETFTHLVKDAAARKRELHKSFLESVELLKPLDEQERSVICDALKVTRVKAGDTIIKQGDAGDAFYILEEGSAVAKKDGAEVMQYKPKDYFGELALIRGEPRAASVIAKTDSKMLSLDRLSFNRLVGRLDTILEARAKEMYSKISK